MPLSLLLRRAINRLFPATCSFCKGTIADPAIPFFCQDCWSELSPMQGAVCPSCGLPFTSDSALEHSPTHRCRSCREAPPQFDQALAAGVFEGPLREAIHVFKYRPLRALGKPLGEWMTRQIRQVSSLDVIMPVPLHRTRLRERGFNQSLLLAAAVRERFGISLACDRLVRVRPTRPQVLLAGIERALNVRGAFAVALPEQVAGKRVLLVDDVYTTGSTLNECSRVLKAAGADAVIALTLARTADR